MELNDLGPRLQRLVDNSEPLQHAVGQFAKEEALDAAERDLGSDRAFSGWKSKVRLGAGYDLGTPVVLNLRPAGMWMLAEDGRKRSKQITNRRRNGKKALTTPYGPKANARSTPSRGHKTLTDVENNIEKGIVAAANKGVNEMIRKAGF